MTPNARGLPETLQDAGVLKDKYSYDANGNVTAIADQQESVFGRTMVYDDLDRLASASAPNVWGSATYKYDTVDNLRVANVGTRNTTISVNANNQVNTVAINGANTSYIFDTRGNLKSKGTQNFGFDLGNRLISSPGGNYAYDGLGRRTKIASSDSSTRIQVYSQAGQLLWATSTGGPRPASTTAYIYLAGKQIAEVQTTGGVNATQYVHTDALGSPVAHSTSANPAVVINRSRFEPYGYVAQGTKPSANTSVIGFTGHVQVSGSDALSTEAGPRMGGNCELRPPQNRPAPTWLHARPGRASNSTASTIRRACSGRLWSSALARAIRRVRASSRGRE